ncbi:MAG: sel1 repeat family protein, partial [Muribaculaceae bacterium]|nr:sel1 repeat family protein [Muribaculaceae bacterium]
MMPFAPCIVTAGIFLLLATVSAERTATRQLAQKAREGDPRAIYHLAALHDIGYDSIPVDSARSTALYRLAAEKGYTPAQTYLGFRYFKGEFVRQNADSALYWLNKAADAGDAGAANNLGYLYAAGEFGETDYVQARKWFEKAAAANIHTAEAQLADLYTLGLGGAHDSIAAGELYTRAVIGGIHDAEYKLISLEEEKWKELPADSLLKKGEMFNSRNRGLSVAAVLFKAAADKGNAEAMLHLGEAYARGKGVPYDHDLSIEYYLRAALGGNKEAESV